MGTAAAEQMGKATAAGGPSRSSETGTRLGVMHWIDADSSAMRRFLHAARLTGQRPLTGWTILCVECDLEGGASITFGDWKVEVVATPGHSPDHVSFLATKKGGKRILFAGDALASAGKLWSPYTSDWDHWTDLGLRPTAKSLRDLHALKADVLLPAHGEPITAAEVGTALTRTATAVEEVAFLKSYERYTRDRLKDPPKYALILTISVSGKARPSILNPSFGLTPAISANVTYGSAKLTMSLHTFPAGVIPGQLAMNGTRDPPSHMLALAPLTIRPCTGLG